MNPTERASQRFFAGLSQACPVDSISHIYLNNLIITQSRSLIDVMLEAGFNGTVVAARASIADQLQSIHPDSVLLNDHPSNHEPADHILLELNQGREAARTTIEDALTAISKGGRVWIFGSQESGILSISKRFSQSKTALYKGHLRLVSLAKTSQYQEKPRKKTAATIPVLDSEGFCQFTCRDLPITSRPGLFSWQGADPASLLLLDAMAKLEFDPGPQVLDWGCGTGLLSAVLAKRWPNSFFTLSDDLWSAVRCAKLTMSQNQLAERSRVIAEDGIGPILSQQKFSTIISNPPFHRGVRTDSTAVETFIKKGVEVLEKGGSLWLVGNSFLNYSQQLSKHLQHVETVVENSKFSIIRGRR
ncbi:MAG: class I SAM-dependent methyltransferase [Magnetococcales bacterium]|nr:class I SAM-dependent methyltransferase [Magnetococcales bacterium]